MWLDGSELNFIVSHIDRISQATIGSQLELEPKLTAAEGL